MEDPHPTQQLSLRRILSPSCAGPGVSIQSCTRAKHHTTGVNLQVACTLTGRRAWVSQPFPDTHPGFTALKDSRLLDVIHQATHIGDKGHTSVPRLITPIKKPAGCELHDTEKEFNKKINTIRYLIERSIAQLKRLIHRGVLVFPS